MSLAISLVLLKKRDHCSGVGVGDEMGYVGVVVSSRHNNGEKISIPTNRIDIES